MLMHWKPFASPNMAYTASPSYLQTLDVRACNENVGERPVWLTKVQKVFFAKECQDWDRNVKAVDGNPPVFRHILRRRKLFICFLFRPVAIDVAQVLLQ